MPDPNEQPIDRLIRDIERPWIFRDEFGVLLYYDQRTQTLNMVEMRLFDVTDVPRDQRAAVAKSETPR